MELKQWVTNVVRVLVSTTLLAVSSPRAYADGGALRYWERREVYELAVFTVPTPLAVGPVDISVLILDSATGEPVPNMVVTLELSQPSQSVPHVIQRASAGGATNRLFYHSLCELPRPGNWDVDLRVSGPRGAAHGQFALSVADAPSRSEVLWAWYCWPALLVAVYVIHQWLVLRRSRTANQRVG